jgi:curved DNA-binding protein CbpA
VAKREPHVVLGVEPTASATQIKAAWRKLARSHHPDLIGDDPEASRIATRQMAEINEAYAAMTRPGYAAGHSGPGRGATGAGTTFDEDAPQRRGGPPKPKPARPVTGRLDLSGTFRPRNAPLRESSGGNGAPGGTAASSLRGQAPMRWTTEEREPPRASHPSGPLERDRVRNFRPPPLPPVDAARDYELEFGKFRGHTLGQVAAFEPSYVDWLARTITRDPELVAAARSVKADLDARGVVRRPHPIGENERRENDRRAQANGAG